MLSLAAMRYRNVFAHEGGPIEHVMSGDFSVLGRRHKQANAFLKPELAVGKPSYSIYGQADGTGSSESSSVACHMAISEALERWAFLATHKGSKAKTYGFDIDLSSNGMTAYPGLFRAQAAGRARMEALERYALISWWDGRFNAEKMASPFPGVDMVRIHHNAGSGEVVVLVQRSRVGVAYGHAAGRTLASAAVKAAVELARSDFVIASHRAKGVLVKAANFLERRALYYSTEAGYAAFEERISRRACKPQPIWQPLFDGEIPGPWAKWATVWRCVVAMPTDAFLDPREDFFFW